ncbi:MBL fold metallo-hydrolase [uncultured Aquimarina sp.]|uniref:MBL fold metallo-hydrolase n=1 Tax=uncultured Aquimarina sp. TaxID=575652 RepID=UPI002633BA72|nr:MBL fold metallo-hydrolase [uncultured Aquimarina sp.]
MVLSVIDELFKMKRQAGDYNKIKEILDVQPHQEELFSTFFTEESSKKYERYSGDGIRTRYFGHACVLDETKEISILVDPVISYDGYESDINRFTASDLPEEIDYVLITHNHQDHVLLETLLQLRYSIKTIVIPSSGKGNLQDPSLRLLFENIGISQGIIFLGTLQSSAKRPQYYFSFLETCKINSIN